MSQVSTGSASTRLRPPRLLLCVSLIFAARVFGAFMAPIADCDEVFNYWEPVHYLLFGTGLQTWEYSPFYALRSYLYLVLHASPLHFALTAMNYVSELIPELALEVNVHQVFGMPTKVVLFYLLRLLLAGASSLAEARFVMAATRAMHRTLGTSAPVNLVSFDLYPSVIVVLLQV
jgi:alpha-1,2-mannosyltransferase